jgi:type VI secretion system secreted protein Hcp
MEPLSPVTKLEDRIMRLIKPFGRAALAASFCLIAALPASSASSSKIYMVLENSGQAEHKSPSQGHRVEVESYNQSIVSPRDASTGMASGKRQHSVIRITKDVDSLSPILQRTVSTNEVLKEVAFEFTRINAGKEQVYRTIKLVNATVAGIQKRKTAAGKTSREIEEVSFAYEKIEQTNNTGNKTFNDSWTSK